MECCIQEAMFSWLGKSTFQTILGAMRVQGDKPPAGVMRVPRVAMNAMSEDRG